MKSVRINEFGGPDVLTVVDVPVPTPAPGEVLIRVESAAVNFADVVRRRADPYPFPTPLPFTLGGEVAGTVEALGDGVDGPPPGTPVFALAGHDGSGGYAQYVVSAAAGVIPVPLGLELDQAAGLVVAGTTAMLALTEVGGLREGETVLVEGAGGGVGLYAVQIARLLGARVIAAASTPARRSAALEHGAQHAVDSSSPGWVQDVRSVADGGVDVVLQIGGEDTFRGVVDVLAPFGRVVVLGMPGGRPLQLDGDLTMRVFYDPALGQSLHAFNLGAFFGLRPQAAVAALTTLVGHVASGAVTVPVGTVLPLDDAAEAHRLLETRATTGKVVLKPWA